MSCVTADNDDTSIVACFMHCNNIKLAWNHYPLTLSHTNARCSFATGVFHFVATTSTRTTPNLLLMAIEQSFLLCGR